MNIAVTAATGQLGQLIVNGLLDKGASHNVIAIARDEEKAAPLAKRGAEIRIADYHKPDTLTPAFSGVDKLLFISSGDLNDRQQQHKNVVDAAKAAGVDHILYTSGTKAATTTLIIAADHKATEAYIQQSGLDYTFLRNNWYTENYLDKVVTAKETGYVTAAAGDGRVASATRADYAAGAVEALLGEGHKGQVYELGGDYAWNYHELAEAISQIIDKPVVYNPVDPETLTQILISVGLDEDTASFVAALDSNIADGVLEVVTHDLSNLIGRPTTPLRQGLEQAIFE